MSESIALAGDQFLRDLWYMPALASSLAPGQMRREMLLGEPVVLGRLKSGEIFALRDICPHRGVPLSAGRILAEGTVAQLRERAGLADLEDIFVKIVEARP